MKYVTVNGVCVEQPCETCGGKVVKIPCPASRPNCTHDACEECGNGTITTVISDPSAGTWAPCASPWLRNVAT